MYAHSYIIILYIVQMHVSEVLSVTVAANIQLIALCWFLCPPSRPLGLSPKYEMAIFGLTMELDISQLSNSREPNTTGLINQSDSFCSFSLD